jgi:hypothetical protein
VNYPEPEPVGLLLGSPRHGERKEMNLKEAEVSIHGGTPESRDL